MYSLIRACDRVSSGGAALGVGGNQAIFSEQEEEKLIADAEDRMLCKNALTLGGNHLEIGYYFEEVRTSLKVHPLCFFSCNALLIHLLTKIADAAYVFERFLAGARYSMGGCHYCRTGSQTYVKNFCAILC